MATPSEAPPRPLTVADYWKGTQAYALMVAWRAQGKPIFTIRSEAERRAAICLACPKHIKPASIKDKSWLKKWTSGKMRGQIEGRTTTVDASLGQCGVCGCENRTLVHIHNDMIKATKGSEVYPKNCWKPKL